MNTEEMLRNNIVNKYLRMKVVPHRYTITFKTH